mmetsp:Transcript_19959/g.56093  ORF Transcript_19959/g.56093 Transcript_19959/m.56093 type:complete len:263 (-) Transcript_19959:1052-1840(-)
MASRRWSMPRNAKDRLETPPLKWHCGWRCFNVRTASMKFKPYSLCSSMSVPMVRMLVSKITSYGLKPALFTSRSRARSQISTLRSFVAAWPSSSNAMTTTAAPYFRSVRAWRRNSSSPSLRLILFAMQRPWQFSRPSTMTLNLEESTMMGTRAMSGSPAMKRRNLRIVATPSIMASSTLMSKTCAPFSTCSRATATASSNFPVVISRENRREPDTLHRSPTLQKLSSVEKCNGSMPLSRSISGREGIARGEIPSTASRMALM